MADGTADASDVLALVRIISRSIWLEGSIGVGQTTTFGTAVTPSNPLPCKPTECVERVYPSTAPRKDNASSSSENSAGDLFEHRELRRFRRVGYELANSCFRV